MIETHSLLYQHFNPEEKAFVERTLDKIEQVTYRYSQYLTAFLNPREAFIVESLAKGSGLHVFSSADHYQTETRRLIIAPEDYLLSLQDFEITLLSLDYARKFNQLKHGQILGTILNQLGIKRQLIGDILLDNERTQLLVDSKIAQLLMEDVTKIARVPVTWTSLSLSEMMLSETEEETLPIIASSWRLDSLLAAAYHLSRQSAVKLIETNKVKVNYQAITYPAQPLKVTDLVSCRGYGRFKITDYQGQTRQGKFKLTLSKIGGE